MHPINSKPKKLTITMFTVAKSLMKFAIFVVMLFTFDNKKAAMNNNMIAIVIPFVSNKYMNGNKINR